MLGAKLELARREFWWFCNLLAPDFYTPDRQYLIDFCNTLQKFYEGKDEVLVVNTPPRHGKSRTLSMFVEWMLGVDLSQKIMTCSYNETLSTTFSKNVRNGIMEEKGDAGKIVFSDIFPKTKIKKGDASANLWSLVGGYNNYLATSPSGTATGFGATMLVVDDMIKNAEEAYNERTLEQHWDWFTNTMLSRLEEGGKIVVVMTRWSTKDLAGRVLEHFEGSDYKVQHINYKALQDDGTMLCDSILSRKSYDMKVKAMGLDIASANYQQEPIDVKGRLYSNLKTYDKLPTDKNGELLFDYIYSYTDTADKGSDYLCSIVYGVYNKECYVLDVVYTKEPMEITEPRIARQLYENKVQVAEIESNNGGRGFGRAVERLLLTKWHSNYTQINLFHQSRNKQARILSMSTWVMEHIYFPNNWDDRFPEFYVAIMEYQKEGKNKHDDAPDALTGVAEKIGKGAVFSFF